jgi:hypothetical protein
MKKSLNLKVITEESEASGGLSEQDIELDFQLQKQDFLGDIKKRLAHRSLLHPLIVSSRVGGHHQSEVTSFPSFIAFLMTLSLSLSVSHSQMSSRESTPSIEQIWMSI